MSATNELVLIGGGEHAAVVLDAARLSGRVVLGYVDDAPTATMARFDLAWLGDDARALAHPEANRRAYIVAFGALGQFGARQAAVARYAAHDVTFATVVHPRAIVATSAALASGVVVLAGAIINPLATIGAHAIVNTGAVVEHDADVGAFAHVAPGAVLGGGARVGAGAIVGLGARVRDHRIIGAEAVVGMGAVVVDSVADGAIVAGVPARPLAKNG